MLKVEIDQVSVLSSIDVGTSRNKTGGHMQDDVILRMI